MTAGLPIVATSLGATPEIVRDGETGILVPPGDPDALAAALLELIGHPNRCKHMGSNARAIAEKEYSWDSVAENMAEVIQKSI
jgi:glycosyltransferase involved in cell wall biosynthesis